MTKKRESKQANVPASRSAKHMDEKIKEVMSLMGQRSAEAREKAWGKREFKKRMKEWGKLGGRPKKTETKRKENE